MIPALTARCFVLRSARASDRLTRNDSPPDKGLDRALFACVPQVYYHHILQVNKSKGVSEYHWILNYRTISEI
jgi:hypothetical protein